MRSASHSSLKVLALTALAGLLLMAAPPARAQTGTGAPDASCPNRLLPPPPVDTSEQPAPGEASPRPLPVPETAIGGTRMGECELVLPPGAPELPADMTATSWLVQNLDTGAVLAAKNPHARHRPASLIKMLLALVVIRELDPDDVIVPTEEDANQECTCLGIVAGAGYTVHDLLQGLLMHSGNDVAHAFGTALGGQDTALAKMNRLAAQIGALDTRAATTSGLDGPGMMTSAYDMSLIYRHAMRHPEFAAAVGTKKIMFPGGGEGPAYPVYNDNNLLGGYDGFFGGKTGFTDNARHTYAGGAGRGRTRIAVVLLRAEQQPIRVSEQAGRLLDYGFRLASTGAQPVGTIVQRNAPPVSTERAANVPGPANAAASAAASERDPFGVTGWILTLVVAVVIITGFVIGYRRKHTGTR